MGHTVQDRLQENIGHLVDLQDMQQTIPDIIDWRAKGKQSKWTIGQYEISSMPKQWLFR